MSDGQVEGWDMDGSSSSEDSHLMDRNFALLLKPINFLQQSYPLEPDMMFGWRPKLPLSPVPLSYRNSYVDWLVQHLNSCPSSRYRLAYLGARRSNSVKVNQQYDYQWKSRTKYNLNVAVLKDRIQSTGGQPSRRILRPMSSNYKFSSQFEGGNLDAVVAVSPEEFDCFIRSDSNTQGHCNWYYFTVEAEEPGVCRLNICNLTKHAGLYCKGMKPYINEGYGWRQAGDSVQFLEAACRYGSDIRQHQLQFSHHFRLPKQKVEFAYCVPYSYSRLERFVQELKQQHPAQVQCQSLADSLGGVSLPLLTLSNGQSESTKRVVLVTARIHPGESSSSLMLEGFIRALLEQPPLSSLLEQFDFKIVPMLNPDGVILGNFRTSYSGKDLNRQFYTSNKLVYPEICALNQLALQLRKQYRGRFEYYLDLHSHSTRTGLFCYGPEHPRWSGYYLRCRAFAKLMERSSEMFSYQNSIFTINEHKRTTGRAKMFADLQVPYTYTFELSNGFYETTSGHMIPLDETDMQRAGRVILEGLYSFERVHKASMTVLHTAIIGNQRKRKASQRMPTSLKKRGVLKQPSQNSISSGALLRQTSTQLSKQQKRRDNIAEDKNLTIDSRVLHEQITSMQLNFHNNALEMLLHDIKLLPQLPETQDGGSDSEPSDEDLQGQDLQLLHNQIQHREISYPDEPQEQPKRKLPKKKSSIRHPATTTSIRHDTTRRPASTIRHLQRSETAKPERRIMKKPMPEKYLLAQKSFVLNL